MAQSLCRGTALRRVMIELPRRPCAEVFIKKCFAPEALIRQTVAYEAFLSPSSAKLLPPVGQSPSALSVGNSFHSGPLAWTKPVTSEQLCSVEVRRSGAGIGEAGFKAQQVVSVPSGVSKSIAWYLGRRSPATRWWPSISKTLRTCCGVPDSHQGLSRSEL